MPHSTVTKTNNGNGKEWKPSQALQTPKHPVRGFCMFLSFFSIFIGQQKNGGWNTTQLHLKCMFIHWLGRPDSCYQLLIFHSMLACTGCCCCYHPWYEELIGPLKWKTALCLGLAKVSVCTTKVYANKRNGFFRRVFETQNDFLMSKHMCYTML